MMTQVSKSHRRWLLCALPFLAACLCRGDVVGLKDGSRLVGTVTNISAEKVTIETGFAGDLTLDRARVDVVTTDEPLGVALQDGRRLLGTVNVADGQARIEATDGQNTVPFEQVAGVWVKGGPDPLAPPPPPRRKWAYEAAVDMRGKTGNTEAFGVGGGLKAMLKGPEDRLMFYVRGRQAEENGNTTQEEIVGGIDFEQRIGKIHSWYARTEMERDEIEGVDYRSTTGLGYGIYVIEKPNHVLRGRTGFQYRFEKWEDGTTEDAPGLDFGLHHMLKLKDYAQLVTDVTYTPSFEDLGDYQLHHQSALDIPLAGTDIWKLRLGIANDYAGIPPEGKDRLDTMYFGQLVLNWGE